MHQQERQQEGSGGDNRNLSQLQPRMPVFSNDGVHLGHVQRIDTENNQFLLSAPGKYDYWLDFSEIDAVRTGYVLLRITRSEANHRGRASSDRSLPFISPGQ